MCFLTAYPRFPLANENPMVTPRELSSEEAALLSHLSVDEDKVNTIEATSREQSESGKRSAYRFTVKFSADHQAATKS